MTCDDDRADSGPVVRKRWSRPIVGAFRRNLLVVGVPVGVVVAGGVSRLFLDVEAWGAFGQWAGAFGSVLAVGAALHIARSEAARTAQRQHEEQAASELRQARLVVTTVRELSGEDEYVLTQQLGGTVPPTTVLIANRSTRPVLYPRIEGFAPLRGSTVRWDIETEIDSGGGYQTARIVLDPGETEVVPVRERYDPPLSDTEWPVPLVPIVGFIDADGQRWRRVGTGTPQRVADDEPPSGQGPDWYRIRA